MTVHELLSRHSRVHARGRAKRLGARIALLGATLVAAALALERMGVDMPLLWMPDAPPTEQFFARLVSFVAVSLAGLIQGVGLLAVVFALAFLVRRVGPLVLRRRPRPTARLLDRRMRTDRYSAALEARGRFRDLAAAHATARPPPLDTLATRLPSRMQKWMTAGAVLLVLLVALSPGVAGGESGNAPAPGESRRDGRSLILKLLGEDHTVRPDEAAPVQVVAEARFAPERDLNPEVRIEIDGGDPQPTGRRLFLPAGVESEDAVRLDLRAYASGLAPGEHVAVAIAGEARSNEYRFRIDAPAGSDRPKPPPDVRKNRKNRGHDRDTDPEVDPKFVEPLVREGEKVKKRARVPIEVPGSAPLDKSLQEAWPELLKRREAALKRAGLSPHARQLVREYFDLLRPDK